MYPILFDLNLGRLGHLTIGTYGLFYALGFLLALRIGVHYARRDGLPTARIVDLGIITLVAGFIGAKALLYLLHADFYIENPRMILRSLRSAGVFYGGFALAFVAAFFYIRRHRLPFGRVADLAAPALAAGQTIGRLGCFFAGCCFGKFCELPWAVTFTNSRAHELTEVTLNVPLHPTQLYHAFANLVIFGITTFVMRRRRFDGQVFWVYVLLYAVLRFTIEFLRGDHARGLYFGETLSTSQIIAIPAALTGAALLVVLARRAASDPERRRSA